MLMATLFSVMVNVFCFYSDLVVGDGTVNGNRLKEGTTSWEIVKGDDQVIGTVEQIVRAQQFEGQDVWWIQITQDVPGRMHMTDTFLVDRRHLRPIRLNNVRKDVKSVDLIYSGNDVKGIISKQDGTQIPIAKTFQMPRYEGNLWGALFASLPLEEGFSATVPMFQYDQGNTELQVKVLGKTQAKGPQGENVDAWELEVISPKGNRITYLISDRYGELGYRVGPITQRLKTLEQP